MKARVTVTIDVGGYMPEVPRREAAEFIRGEIEDAVCYFVDNNKDSGVALVSVTTQGRTYTFDRD